VFAFYLSFSILPEVGQASGLMQRLFAAYPERSAFSPQGAGSNLGRRGRDKTGKTALEKPKYKKMNSALREPHQEVVAPLGICSRVSGTARQDFK
jgi:hypothetical protein